MKFKESLLFENEVVVCMDDTVKITMEFSGPVEGRVITWHVDQRTITIDTSEAFKSSETILGMDYIVDIQTLGGVRLIKIGDKVKTIKEATIDDESILLGEVGTVMFITMSVGSKPKQIIHVKYSDEILDEIYEYGNYEEATETYQMYDWQLKVIEC